MIKSYGSLYIDEIIDKIRKSKNKDIYVKELKEHINEAKLVLNNIPDLKTAIKLTNSALTVMERIPETLRDTNGNELIDSIEKAGNLLMELSSSLSPVMDMSFPITIGERKIGEEKREEIMELSLNMSYPFKIEAEDKIKIEGIHNKSHIMKHLPFFADMEEDELKKIALKIKLRKYEKENILFNEGEEGKEIYIIKSGDITIYKPWEKKEFVTLDRGDMFGEMGVITKGKRSFSAKVSSSMAELYVITDEDFHSIMKRHSQLRLNLLKILCRRIDITNKKLLGYIKDYYIYIKDRDKLEKSRNKSKILSSLNIFYGLREEILNKISSKIRMKKYDRGDIIFNQGDRTEFLYIIKSGEVTVYNPIKGNTKRDMAILGKGDILGEMGVISDTSYSLSAGVNEKSELYMITKKDFLNMLRTYPELSINLEKILCKRINETNIRLLELVK